MASKTVTRSIIYACMKIIQTWFTLYLRDDYSTTASYPDVSLLMKMCAQRKAGRRQRASVPFPWFLAVHHQSLVSRSPLPCKKRSAWGGGWLYQIFFKYQLSFVELYFCSSSSMFLGTCTGISSSMANSVKFSTIFLLRLSSSPGLLGEWG